MEKPKSIDAPLSKATAAAHLFGLNMMYSSACVMTVKAWQALEDAPKTKQNLNDLNFYLEALFFKPLEENI
jgi:hypothetical protein